MEHINFEVKARTTRHADIRAWLKAHNAEFRGTDRQKDTYYDVPNGRLKLRQGAIENNLIHYLRADDPQARVSDVALTPIADGPALDLILRRAVGLKIEVEKTREIYFIANVKFHLDVLTGLGEFVEIEAIATGPETPVARLREQCLFYMQAFQIAPEDVESRSYSDMATAL